MFIPYFEPMVLKLNDVTPQHIQNFYTEQLKRVKGTAVKSYHANIHKAFKDARRLQLIDSNPMDCVDPPKTTPFHGQAYTVTETKVDGNLQVVREDLTKNSSSYRTLPLVALIKTLLEKKRKVSANTETFSKMAIAIRIRTMYV